jgi:hypothetical protein
MYVFDTVHLVGIINEYIDHKDTVWTGLNLRKAFNFCSKMSVIVHKQASKQENKGAMTIKAQTKDKNNKNSTCDKRQSVLQINTPHSISHKECTI